jgi:hypothetical protein
VLWAYPVSMVCTVTAAGQRYTTYTAGPYEPVSTSASWVAATLWAMPPAIRVGSSGQTITPHVRTGRSTAARATGYSSVGSAGTTPAASKVMVAVVMAGARSAREPRP